jgi:nucleotide-binding universal stress UspA family protein
MKRIIVGLDEGPASGLALRWALREAALRHAPLCVIATWAIPTPHFNLYRPPSYDDLADDVRSEREALATNLIAAARRLEPECADVDVDLLVLHGSPEEVLIREAGGADLVVLGARGLHGLQRAALGSTSAAVLAAAPCPVVILHAGPHDHDLFEEVQLAEEIAMLSSTPATT